MNSDTLIHLLMALIIGIGLVVVLRFEIACLRDLAQTPDIELRGLTRPVWQALIVISIPIGGILYLTYGKVR